MVLVQPLQFTKTEQKEKEAFDEELTGLNETKSD